MRIKVNLIAPKLPILYRHRFMAMIKEALENSDATYKRSLYPDKGSEQSKIVKPFCFNVIMPSGKTIKKEKIIIDEEAKTLTFFSSSQMYGKYDHAGLKKKVLTHYSFPGFAVIVDGC